MSTISLAALENSLDPFAATSQYAKHCVHFLYYVCVCVMTIQHNRIHNAGSETSRRRDKIQVDDALYV